jgi:hypothetical protein
MDNPGGYHIATKNILTNQEAVFNIYYASFSVKGSGFKDFSGNRRTTTLSGVVRPE